MYVTVSICTQYKLYRHSVSSQSGEYSLCAFLQSLALLYIHIHGRSHVFVRASYRVYIIARATVDTPLIIVYLVVILTQYTCFVILTQYTCFVILTQYTCFVILTQCICFVILTQYACYVYKAMHKLIDYKYAHGGSQYSCGSVWEGEKEMNQSSKQCV